MTKQVQRMPPLPPHPKKMNGRSRQGPDEEECGNRPGSSHLQRENVRTSFSRHPEQELGGREGGDEDKRVGWKEEENEVGRKREQRGEERKQGGGRASGRKRAKLGWGWRRE